MQDLAILEFAFQVGALNVERALFSSRAPSDLAGRAEAPTTFSAESPRPAVAVPPIAGQ